jgi:hypothetical protein
MSFSKHSFKRKQQQQKQKKPSQPRIPFNRNPRILINRCDICNDPLPETGDDTEYRINMLNEINDSYESEYDKVEPKLMLCSSCQQEYMIPSYC